MENFKKLTMYDENTETTTSNSTTPLLGLANVSGIFEKLAFEAAFPDEDFDWDNYYDWVSENPKKAYDILALWVRDNYR